MSLSSLIKPLVAAGITAAAITSCKPGDVSRQTPIHINPNMDSQEKYKAQSESKFFEDGRTMRTPVEGTVAHGSFIADITVAEGKDAAGNFVKEIPSLAAIGFKGDIKAFLERGQNRFAISCIPCHGAVGAGNGIVAQKGYPGVANLIDPVTAARLSPGQIYSAIKNGVNNGNMRKFDAELSVSDRWAVTAYVRLLQSTLAKKVVAPASASLKGVMDSKRKLADGSEVDADDAYIIESIRTPMAKLATGGMMPSGMTPFPEAAISDAQVKDLSESLKTLK